MFLTSNIEQNVTTANQQIALNIKLPDDDTQVWDIPRKAYQQDLWFIKKPRSFGWKDYTQEQMMQNVVNVDQQQFDISWFEPSQI